MGAGDRELDALYAQLTEAIMKAVSGSADVYGMLIQLQEKGLIHRESVFNLLISLEELSTLMDISPLPDPPRKVEPAPCPRVNLREDRIDGRKLSSNEKKFEEFCRSIFNEGDWLKKARLKL